MILAGLVSLAFPIRYWSVLFLPFLWMAILFLRTTDSPRWVNWLGIGAALAGIVWIFPFLRIPPNPILILLNIILGMIWLIGLASYLNRRTV